MPLPLPTVAEVFMVPESDRSQQTDKGLEVTIVYRVRFNVSSSTKLPATYQGFDASDGSTSVPVYGEDYATVLGQTEPTYLYVNNINPQRSSASEAFLDVYVTFSSNGVNPNQTGKWNTSIRVSGVKSTETTTRYYPSATYPAGLLITNSAGDQYDPLQVRSISDEQINIGYTTDTIDGDTIATFRNKINTESITMTIKGVARTFAAYTLKIENISYSISQTGATGVVATFSNYDVQIEMIYRADNWLPKLVDTGFRDINGVPFQDGQAAGLSPGGSNPVTAAVYMDGNGGQLIGAGSDGATTQPVMIIGGVIIVGGATPGTETLDGAIDFGPLLSGIE